MQNETLLQGVAAHTAYALNFLAIIAAMFLVAYLVEKAAKKKAGDTERFFTTRKMAVIGVFSAIAFILHYYDFPLPFAPPFYKLDFSEIPVLICGYAFGPVAGVMTEFLKVLLKLAFKGTSTAFVGDLANFVVGCSFILPATVLYSFIRTRKGAVIACITGTLSMTVFGSLFNAVYLLPTYAALMMPMETIIAAGQAVNPNINSVATMALYAVAPFNLLKGTLVSLVTMLVYKSLSPIIKEGMPQRFRKKAYARVEK